MEPPTVVIDNGTGYSKMGYAGNLDPSYIIPSTIATSLAKVSWIDLMSVILCFKIIETSEQTGQPRPRLLYW